MSIAEADGSAKNHALPGRVVLFVSAGALLLAACGSGSDTSGQDLSAPTDSAVSDEVNPPATEAAASGEADGAQIDTSYWNIAPDREEILSFLATEYDFPVDSRVGSFTQTTPADQIAFEFTLAFLASRNTRSLLPLARYFGYDSVEDWDADTNFDPYQNEVFFNDINFDKAINDPAEGYLQFNKGIFGPDGDSIIEDEFLSDGNRSISGTISFYILQLFAGYSDGGVNDPGFQRELDESTWEDGVVFPTNLSDGIEMTMILRPDGSLQRLELSE